MSAFLRITAFGYPFGIFKYSKGPGGSMSQVVGLPNNSYKFITNTAWVNAQLCNLQKGCTRLAAASDKVYQLLAHGRWFSSGSPASSTTKTGRHDITEILLNMALNTIKQTSSIVDISYKNV
jgi:hypothetical protein